jgi:hypothetical protein
MKKVLVAGAALMMAGAMVVPAAVAEVNLSGDARVRYVGESGYGVVGDDYRDEFNSRVRLKIEGVAKGGAFAKARLILADGTWDGSDSLTGTDEVDYAYIGLPLGAVTVYGGMVDSGLADFSDFFYNGGGETRMQVNYEGEGFDFTAFYQIDGEGDATDDNSSLGVVLGFSPADNMNVSTILWYFMDDAVVDADTPDAADGLAASVRFEGEMDTLALEAELSYREEGVTGQNAWDDGMGGYVGAVYEMGAWTPGMHIGFTSDGYAPVVDYGFFMIGGDTPITGLSFGGSENSYWGALTTDYAVSEKITLTGNLVYLDMEGIDYTSTTPGTDGDAFEISGGIDYAVSEGARLRYRLGYLAIDEDNVEDIDAVGHFAELSIKF